MYAKSNVIDKDHGGSGKIRLMVPLVALSMLLSMTFFALTARAVDEEVLEANVTSTTAETPATETTAVEEESSMTLWYIVGGVVVVAGLGMLYMKRK